MAFDFLGTLSLEQLRDFRLFIQAEIEDIEQQINTLRVELDNIQRTRDEFVTADSNFGGNVLQVIYEREFPDVIVTPPQDDTNSAELVSKVKQAFLPNIKYKRERLEFKIKKLTDKIEQIKETIDRKAISKTQAIQQLNNLEKMFNESNGNHLFQTTEQMKNYRQGIFT